MARCRLPLLDADSLERLTIGWLHLRHADDVTIGFTRGNMAEIERLRDKMTAAEFDAMIWHAWLGAIM
jgi:hypothetical protein